MSRVAVGALMLVIAALAACTSNSDPARFEVTLVAGGGEHDVDENGVADGAQVRLPGPVRSLSSDQDGTLWALVGDDEIVRVTPDGEVRRWAVGLPENAVEIADLAVDSDSRVYVLLDDGSRGQTLEAAVYAWTPEHVEPEPAFGVPATDEQARDGAPASPDGTSAESAALGEVLDIAVDDSGRVVFAENTVAGGGFSGASIVRRVQDDGSLVTLAGRPWPDYDVAPEAEDLHEAAFPSAGSAASEIDVLGDVAVEPGPDNGVFIRTFRSVLWVDADSSVDVVLGDRDADQSPVSLNEQGPLSEQRDATAVDVRTVLGRGFFSANASGDLLVGMIGSLDEVRGDRREPFMWSVTDGGASAQEIADARSDRAGASSTLLVTRDGDVLTADLSGDGATWLDDQTIAVATHDRNSGVSIVVGFDVP